MYARERERLTETMHNDLASSWKCYVFVCRFCASPYSHSQGSTFKMQILTI